MCTINGAWAAFEESVSFTRSAAIVTAATTCTELGYDSDGPIETIT